MKCCQTVWTYPNTYLSNLWKSSTYLRWYNEKRIKISLGGLSPLEYRVSLGFAA
nr:IS3 family transposase [Natronospirillum operosum]